MANPDYKKFYSVLGVFQDDDWDTVRTAYKRQMRRWHPDRFQDTEQRKIAEDKSKDINLAYKMLDDYYREFGSLPPDESTRLEPPDYNGGHGPLREHEAASAHDHSCDAQHDTASYSNSRQSPRRGYSRILFAGAIITIGYLMLEPMFSDHQNVPEKAVHEYPDSDRQIDSIAASRAVISNPPMTSAKANAADIHDSWPVNEKNPGYTPKPSPTIISVGSSMQDVLAVQGRPLRQTDTAWDYGLSRIIFEDGKVIGWYENPMNPLIVQR